jgi:hypothetical protein
LTGLLNRSIASDDYGYSQAMRAKQKLGKWTPQLLSQFLADPAKFVGTTVLPLKVSDAEIKNSRADSAEQHHTCAIRFGFSSMSWCEADKLLVAYEFIVDHFQTGNSPERCSKSHHEIT